MMKTKVLLILFSLFLFQFFIACCREVSHLDFSAMEALVEDDFINEGDTLMIDLWAMDVEYLAAHWQDLGFAQSMALSCDEGYKGMKYPFTNLTITSDADFNNDLSAGDDLSSLFFLRTFVDNKVVAFAEFVADKDVILRDNYRFFCAVPPSREKTHQFQFAFTKSNGERIEATVPAVTWE